MTTHSTTDSAAALSAPRLRQRSLRAIEIRWGTLFILPWIIGFILFTAGPMLFSLYLSFTDYSILSNQDPRPVGFKTTGISWASSSRR